MPWCALEYQATRHHTTDSLAVTQDNFHKNYDYSFEHILKKFRAFDL